MSSSRKTNRVNRRRSRAGARRLREGTRLRQAKAVLDHYLSLSIGSPVIDVARAWQSWVEAAIREEMADEEQHRTREHGEQQGLSSALIDDVIAQTLQHTRADATEWAIARANLSALAGMAAI